MADHRETRSSHGPKTSGTDNPDAIMSEAGKRLRGEPPGSPALSGKTPEELIHELQVHQAELELQNEALREAQLALGESRDKYLDLYEFAPIGYLTLTKQAVIEEGNLTSATMLGVDRRALIHDRFRKFVAEEDRDQWDRFFVSLLRTPDKRTMDLRLTRGDSSPFYARVEWLRMIRKNDSPSIRMAIIDISEQRQAEIALEQAYEDIEKKVLERTGELSAANRDLGQANDTLRIRERELRLSEEKFRTMTNLIPQLAWIASGDGSFLWVNQRCLDYTGRTAQELEGRGWDSVIEPGILPAVRRQWKAATKAVRMLDMEIPLRGADGIFRPFLTRVAPVKDPDGQVARWFGTNTDITAMKQAEAALAAANRKLTILSSITRHDILNQLTVIESFLEMSREECTGNQKLEGYFDRLTKSAKIIEDQIQFTGLYEELGVKAPAWQSPGTIAGAAARMGDFGGIRFSIEEMPLEILADPLLERVLYNLFDNAFRHGGRVTEIRVGSRISDEAATITVEDNGDGIPALDKEQIFQRGVGKNTGLGLFLVREILAITGITIQETGESGTGARFEITVPKGAYHS
jgi:PAS domain S-box-containing protein